MYELSNNTSHTSLQQTLYRDVMTPSLMHVRPGSNDCWTDFSECVIVIVIAGMNGDYDEVLYLTVYVKTVNGKINVAEDRRPNKSRKKW